MWFLNDPDPRMQITLYVSPYTQNFFLTSLMHAPSKVKGRFLSTASLLGMVGPGDSVNNVLASKNAFLCGGGYWAISLQPGQSSISNYKLSKLSLT